MKNASLYLKLASSLLIISIITVVYVNHKNQDANSNKELEIKKAYEATRSSASTTRSNGIQKFAQLFSNKIGFEKGITAAAEATRSDKSEIILTGIELFQLLTKHDQGFEQAAQAAYTMALRVYPTEEEAEMVRTAAIDLFASLLNKNKSLEKATQAAEATITSEMEKQQLAATQLFAQLARRKHSLNEAIKGAFIALQSDFKRVRTAAMELIVMLLDQNYTPAFEAVESFIEQNTTHPLQQELIDLLQKYKK